MYRKLTLILCLAMLALMVGASNTAAQDAAPAAPLGAAFTYQGRLTDNGSPADGMYDLRFILYDAGVGGVQVGVSLTVEDQPVNQGYFTVALDFGASAYDSGARWLEVAVRPGDSSGEYTTLSPRQALTAAPYALYSQVAPWNGLSGMPAGFADGVDNDTTAFWGLGGNAGTDPYTQYLGTSDSQPFELRVNGLRALRLEYNPEAPNLIGGYPGNWLHYGVYGATLFGGGEYSGQKPNLVSDIYGTVSGGIENIAGDNAGEVDDHPFATVGGGYDNTASGSFATVSGGDWNHASGSLATVSGGDWNHASGSLATVSGGDWNHASGSLATVGGGGENYANEGYATVSGGALNSASEYATTVGGGYDNSASGEFATVSGGEENTAGGVCATVSGGYSNDANGDYSFAAGYRAKADANANGSFVWSDSNDFDTTSSAPNQFMARATGGFYFDTAINPDNGSWMAGAALPSGSGQWIQISDRDLKTAVRAVNSRQVLERLASLPISSWSYKGQGESIRHMGPMAQDFYTAFGLGEDSRYIGTLDASGVALAAIQGLYQSNQEQITRLQELERENESMKEILDNIQEHISAWGGGEPPPAITPYLPWGGMVLLAFSLGWSLRGRRVVK